MNLGMQPGVGPGPAQASNLEVQYSYTTAQFDKTSDIAVASIPGLSAALSKGGVYAFTLAAYTTAVNLGGTLFDFGGGTVTASSFMAASITHNNAGVASSYSTTNLTTTMGNGGIIGKVQLITGTITCLTGGTFIPRFAQAQSNVTASSILVGTTLTVEKIA